MTYRKAYDLFQMAMECRRFLRKAIDKADVSDDRVAEMHEDYLEALFEFITDIRDYLDGVLEREV